MRENRLYGSEGGRIELNRSSLPLSGEMSLRDKHSFATMVSEHWLRVEKRCVVQRVGSGGSCSLPWHPERRHCRGTLELPPNNFHLPLGRSGASLGEFPGQVLWDGHADRAPCALPEGSFLAFDPPKGRVKTDGEITSAGSRNQAPGIHLGGRAHGQAVQRQLPQLPMPSHAMRTRAEHSLGMAFAVW